MYGREFVRAINAPDLRLRAALGGPPPAADINHALRAALAPRSVTHRNVSIAESNRRGLVTAAVGGGQRLAHDYRDTQRTRRAWNRAEYGDDPNEMGPQGPASREIDMRTPEGRAEAKTLFPDSTSDLPAGYENSGGRAHVGGINDRLGAMNQREQTTSWMNRAVNEVLSGNAAGRMRAKIPAFRRGSPRGVT